jgi:translation initiation factor 2 subunit 3
MAQQQSASTPSEGTPRRIPKQPECNIGSSGHVDHGKCLRSDQYVLVDGVPVTGAELLHRIESSGVLLSKLDGEEVYQFSQNSVVSIGDHLQATRASSLLYVQRYEGPMFSIKGETGRELCVTPEHPLLINRKGAIQWIKAKEIIEGDYTAFLARVPLDESLVLPDPMPQMRDLFQVVTRDDAERIRVASQGFTDYSGLPTDDFEKARILLGVPKSRLSTLAHVGVKSYNRFASGVALPSAAQRARIASALGGFSPASLSPDEFLTERRSKRGRRIKKVKQIDVSASMVKWFAFVWSEGDSDSSRVRVKQTIQKSMIDEYARITVEQFGQRVVKYPEGEYEIHSRPFVDYLRFKFGFDPGNESECGISDWVCKLPQDLKAIFLRWFLTLDGEFNGVTGHISVSQLNQKNIAILSYLFHSFGIVPKFNVKRSKTKKGTKEYGRITVSGMKDLKLFAEAIGFEDARIQQRLEAYLSKISWQSKETDRSVPIDTGSLGLLLRETGLIREGFRGTDGVGAIKRASWYRAYSDGRRKGRMSRSNLLLVVNAIHEHLVKVEESASSLSSLDPDSLRHHSSLIGLPLSELAGELGYGSRRLARILKKGSTADLSAVARILKAETKGMVRYASRALEQLRDIASSSLEFDRIVSVKKEEYKGLVFDLTVPEHANFVAGLGATICHNTSVIQSITGIWASAHSEELKRGITIKVGYADAALYKCPVTPAPECYSTSPVCPVCGSETQLLRAVSFVDAPGHESLMTNMLAGAALMDGVILVIAANEPVPMPQTREHLLALQMLGMKKMVVVQNKIDRVDTDGARKNYEAIRQFLANTVGANAPIIPVSAQNKINIDALLEAIEENIPTPKHDLNANPRMLVLRSFDVNRPGADVKSLVGGVLGGSLVSGELRVGEEIEISPGIAEERSGKYTPILTKVASLGTGAGMTDKVGPGGLIALGTTLDPRLTKGDVLVGNLVGKPGTLPPSRTHITLDLQLFEQAVGSGTLIKVDKIRATETLRLNIGTASTLGTVTSARDVVAELDLKKPVVTEEGGRVAISRRIAERWRLIGSGVVR